MIEDENKAKATVLQHAISDDLPDIQDISDEELSTDVGGVGITPAAEIKDVLKVIANSAEVAATGLAMGAFFKLEQHDKNPSQVPIDSVIKAAEDAAGMAVVAVVAEDLEKDV